MHFFQDNLDINRGVGLTLANVLFLSFTDISAVISTVGSCGALVLTGLGIVQAWQRVKLNQHELKRKAEEQKESE